MNNDDTQLKELTSELEKFKSGVDKTLDQAKSAFSKIESIEEEIKQLRRHQPSATGRSARREPRSNASPVSEGCARWLGSIAVLGAAQAGRLSVADGQDQNELIERCVKFVGLQQKAALTTSDIPLPVDYEREVIELVEEYGTVRRYGTVYPVSVGTTNVPRLTTSPAFGFIDMSGSVPEKSPQIANLAITLAKAGGLVRVPAEIDMDSIVPMGQFLARYIARQMAAWEDVCGWTADGTSTYKSMTGAGPAAVAAGNVVQLTTGNTAPDDITLANLRSVRSQVSEAVLGRCAYYMNVTMESHLATFNTDFPVYNADGAKGPSLDGFPIRWVDVMPVLDSSAHADQIQVLFGAAEYLYLATAGPMRIDTSKEVFLATDEIAVRALERFAVKLTENDAMAAVQLAAS